MKENFLFSSPHVLFTKASPFSNLTISRINFLLILDSTLPNQNHCNSLFFGFSVFYLFCFPPTFPR